MFDTPLAEVAACEEGTTVELPLANDAAFDLVVLQEDIRYGERVRRYELQLRRDGAWQTFAAGSCIGHKRIHRLPAALSGERLRLVVLEALAPPRIRRLAVHAAPAAP
jgi:alpha-L-fucosidase